MKTNLIGIGLMLLLAGVFVLSWYIGSLLQ
jgi:hypothetical protein